MPSDASNAGKFPDNHDPSLPQWARSRLKTIFKKKNCRSPGGTHMAGCLCILEKLIKLEAEVAELKKMKDNKPFLSIEIHTPIPEEEAGPSVSIQWLDSPQDVAAEEWDAEDQAWTKIKDGIHALLFNLGPIPEGGWDVKFTCSNFNPIVEPELTQAEYRNRMKEEDEND